MTVLPVNGQVVRAERVLDVTSPAYDALSVSERQQFRLDHPLSFLHVTRSAADEPDAATVDNATLVARGRASLERLLAEDVFAPAQEPSLYVYGLTAAGHSQLGLIGEYDSQTFADLAVPHEGVNDHRVRLLAEHFTTVGAASSPVALTVRDDGAMQLDLEQVARSTPLLDFVAVDGLHQQVWRVDDQALAERLSGRMQQQRVYIVDGHHRAAANAHLLAQGHPLNLLACVFPSGALRTLGFNRLVRPIGDMTPAAILSAIGRRFPVTARELSETEVPPPNQGQVHVYAAGTWHTIELDERPISGGAGIRLGSLDPTVVDREIVRGLADRVEVLYAPDRGDLQAQAATAAAEGQMLFALAPVEVDDMLAVADGGLTMPEKSTYFSPKVRSGLFLRRFE